MSYISDTTKWSTHELENQVTSKKPYYCPRFELVQEPRYDGP